MQRAAEHAVESVESLPPGDDAADVPGFIEPAGEDDDDTQRATLRE
jgi:hypothetical protein